MIDVGEINKEIQPSVEWQDFAAIVQSVDPLRPVEELAYDHLHYREEFEQPNNPQQAPKQPFLDLFILDYCESISEAYHQAVEFAAIELAATIVEYAKTIIDKFPEQIEENDRRVTMWLSAIKGKYSYLWADIDEKLLEWNPNAPR